MLVSVVQWSESAICIHISLPSWISLPHHLPSHPSRSSQSTELSSLLSLSLFFSLHPLCEMNIWPCYLYAPHKFLKPHTWRYPWASTQGINTSQPYWIRLPGGRGVAGAINSSSHFLHHLTPFHSLHSHLPQMNKDLTPKKKKKMFCWNPWESFGFLSTSHPFSLHGPAINLSLLQTLAFQVAWPHCAMGTQTYSVTSPSKA